MLNTSGWQTLNQTGCCEHGNELSVSINCRKFIDYLRNFFFLVFFTMAQQPPRGPRPPHYRGFIITLRHTTLGRAPLDQCSARRRDLCLTTHNTHKRLTSMPAAGFEPTVPASKRPQNQSLDCTATGIS